MGGPCLPPSGQTLPRGRRAIDDRAPWPAPCHGARRDSDSAARPPQSAHGRRPRRSGGDTAMIRPASSKKHASFSIAGGPCGAGRPARPAPGPGKPHAPRQATSTRRRPCGRPTHASEGPVTQDPLRGRMCHPLRPCCANRRGPAPWPLPAPLCAGAPAGRSRGCGGAVPTGPRRAKSGRRPRCSTARGRPPARQDPPRGKPRPPWQGTGRCAPMGRRPGHRRPRGRGRASGARTRPWQLQWRSAARPPGPRIGPECPAGAARRARRPAAGGWRGQAAGPRLPR